MGSRYSRPHISFKDAMSDINKLRSEAIKRTKAMSRKMDRLLTGSGVMVVGSEFDIRKTPNEISKMRTRDLNSYISRVNSFVDRKTKFVAGRNGAPLPADLVEQYTRLETARNIRERKRENSYSDVFIEPANMSVAQRRATIEHKKTNVLTLGADDEKGFKRDISKVNGSDALKALIKANQKALKPKAVEAMLKVQKENHAKFLEKKGEAGLAKIIRGMSTRAFDILRNHTSYIGMAEYVYLVKESVNSEQKAAKIRDYNVGKAEELALWASKIDKKN